MTRSVRPLSMGQAVLMLLGARFLLELTVRIEAILVWQWNVARSHESATMSFATAFESVIQDPLGPALAQLLSLGVVVLSGAHFIAPSANPLRTLHVRRVEPRLLGLAILMGFGLQLPLVELTAWVTEIVPRFALDEAALESVESMTRIDSTVRAFTVPLAAVLIAPLSEELLFRALLLPNLSLRVGSRTSIATTAVLFGIFHVLPLYAIFASIAGAILGLVFVRHRSVLPCIAVHAAFNAVPLLLRRELVEIPGFNTEPGSHVPWSWVIGSSVLFGTAGFLLWHAPDAPKEQPRR